MEDCPVHSLMCCHRVFGPELPLLEAGGTCVSAGVLGLILLLADKIVLQVCVTHRSAKPQDSLLFEMTH